MDGVRLTDSVLRKLPETQKDEASLTKDYVGARRIFAVI
jgi:hypothetical protein